jgi:hypothetical protein
VPYWDVREERPYGPAFTIGMPAHAAWSACGQALGMITPAGLAS